jgi:HK97 family phage major capsid protein
VSQDAEAGQGVSTIVSENIFNMYSRVINPSNAVWLVNQAVLPELFSLSLSVGTGGAPMFLSNVADSPELRLLGLPLVICEQASDLGTIGDLVLANLRDGYILAEKGGIQSDVSIHVRFIYDESVWRWVVRLDGQPVRASALTPYKSTPTQSHFVALATRP